MKDLEIFNKDTFYKIKIVCVAEKLVQYYTFEGLTRIERKIYILLNCHDEYYTIFFTNYYDSEKYVKANLSKVVDIEKFKEKIQEKEFTIYLPKEKECVRHLNTFETQFGHFLHSRCFTYDYKNNLMKHFNLDYFKKGITTHEAERT